MHLEVETTIDITPSPRILKVIAEIDLQIYQCLAELIDNSLDELRKAAEADPTIERNVDVDLPKPTEVSRHSSIFVADNGRGMTTGQLQQSLRAGSSGNGMFGNLGLFGMGFNIATGRLGDRTVVKTGVIGEEYWSVATVTLSEMQRNRSFSVPFHHETKGINDHGTTIGISGLKSDIVDTLKNRNMVNQVRASLGRVYTYMLRDAENGVFSGREILGGCGLSLGVNGQRVHPLIPCIWDPERSVPYKGQEIRAVQKIHTDLRPQPACHDCGEWNSEGAEVCIECGSASLKEIEREISGWVGIQRFDSGSDFGISFFRHGRCIVHNDKNLFDWISDDGDEETEYPVELGRGRIVGEIHIDHVPVNVRKTDFDREQRTWKSMRELVRGRGPLKQERAKALGYSINDSPLGLLFHAYRRYEPGKRYLVPGNGKTALAEDARKWAESFRKNLPEYQTDEKWYEAVERHEEIAAGGRDKRSGADESEADDWFLEEGLGHLLGGDAEAPGEGIDVKEEPAPEETIGERTTRYKLHSKVIPGMDGPIRGSAGKTHVVVRAYTGSGLADDQKRPVQLWARSERGQTNVFVDMRHPLIEVNGWSAENVALVGLAEQLKRLQGLNDPLDRIVSDLAAEYPALKVDPAAVRVRAEGILDDLRRNAGPVVKQDPGTYWASLSRNSKNGIEQSASLEAPMIDWNLKVESGEFVDYLVPGAVIDLMQGAPDKFLDGLVFQLEYSKWEDQAARLQQMKRVEALLLDIDVALQLSGRTSSKEVVRLALSLDILQDYLVQGA